MLETLQIIDSIVIEQRRAVQDQQRRSGRSELYVNYLAAPLPHQTQGSGAGLNQQSSGEQCSGQAFIDALQSATTK